MHPVLQATGSAGQSFGAFLVSGVTLELIGDANDYVGKGLSGGRIIIYPPAIACYDPGSTMVVGNTLLYGATKGEIYINGLAGERFAVRNSGAIAVVEGVGDHGCEYMTGGIVLILGKTGKNFAAGMSGGVAYVLDKQQDFEKKCNTDSVHLERLQQHQQSKALDPEQLFSQLLSHDEQRVKLLVEQHLHYTNSDQAREILDHWHQYVTQFVKIIPNDFRAALQKLTTQQPTQAMGDLLSEG